MAAPAPATNVLTDSGFLSGVQDWINTNIGRIKLMWPLKGGWELWTQAEIAAYFISKNPLFDILREQPVYVNKGQAADFLINNSTVPATSGKIIVELKCQSKENATTFVAGVLSDLQKLSTIDPTFKGTQLLCLGIFFDQSAGNKLGSQGFGIAIIGSEVGLAWKYA
ncbi:hypothetical protein NTE_00300 [Candidatus Nitrososphaera evergladensis SR1]|uniref:Restriction endonuclease type IV Mrr domain-containing protein n=1 Tax=Candidatus Nitrososphaera evergladensis SR1 TaxID=1459636 RepID=A0A075MNJ6_9ARCH|nr:hypothetical protein [Candidatus Nitrososphaera evergladensis]AIF82382.1 hypothetical protein NTE_00300 [Candidatus Nitrososphaera evergladensis SR1]